ncbi:MAG: hypothetical protein WCJ61_03640 [Paludibacter sp.]
MIILKTTYFSRIPNNLILIGFIVLSILLSGNLMGQVANIPIYKSTRQTINNTEDFNTANIFEYTSSQNQAVKSDGNQNLENPPSQKKYEYSVADRNQEKNKIQYELNLSNTTSKYSNKNSTEVSANFNQQISNSKANSSISINQQQTPFQESDKTDNLQSMQKSGPSGNPGDPGVIPVADGVFLLLILLAFYSIFKFKNL